MGCRTLILGLSLLAVTSSVAGAQDNSLVLDSTGRVLLPFHRGGRARTARVVVRDVVPALRGSLAVSCRGLSSFDNMAEPSGFDTFGDASQRGNDLIFTIGLPADKPFLFCSLLSRAHPALTPPELEAMRQQRQDALRRIGDLTPRVAALPETHTLNQRESETRDARRDVQRGLAEAREIARLFVTPRQARIADLLADITAFEQRETDAAVAEIKRLQDDVRKLRDEIAERNLALAELELEGSVRVARLVEIENEARTAWKNAPAKRDLDAATAAENAASQALTEQVTPTYVLLGASHLFLDQADAPVFYRLLSNGKRAVALERAMAFPILTTDSKVFAVVLNRRRVELPEPFRLTFTTTAGTPPDPAPVRPTTKLGEESLVQPRFEGLDTAYRDFVMSFGPPFNANTLVKATISSVMETLTENTLTTTTENGQSKTQGTTKIAVQSVTLLKDEEYPQIRGLYHFNFTTGVAISRLRDPSFVRVQTTLNDPTTTDKDESRYRTEEIRGDIAVKPMFAISIYITPVDIQRPLSLWDRVRPSPMFGFSFVDPQENIYVGGSSEPLRSLQILYGAHIGKITRKREPAAVDDPGSSTAPATDDRYSAAWFFGVSFNLNFIKTIFKGS